MNQHHQKKGSMNEQNKLSFTTNYLHVFFCCFISIRECITVYHFQSVIITMKFMRYCCNSRLIEKYFRIEIDFNALFNAILYLLFEINLFVQSGNLFPMKAISYKQTEIFFFFYFFVCTKIYRFTITLYGQK